MKYRTKTIKKKGKLTFQAQVKYLFWFWLDPYGEVLWLPHNFKISTDAERAIRNHKSKQPSYNYM